MPTTKLRDSKGQFYINAEMAEHIVLFQHGQMDGTQAYKWACSNGQGGLMSRWILNIISVGSKVLMLVFAQIWICRFSIMSQVHRLRRDKGAHVLWMPTICGANVAYAGNMQHHSGVRTRLWKRCARGRASYTVRYMSSSAPLIDKDVPIINQIKIEKKTRHTLQGIFSFGNTFGKVKEWNKSWINLLNAISGKLLHLLLLTWSFCTDIVLNS